MLKVQPKYKLPSEFLFMNMKTKVRWAFISTLIDNGQNEKKRLQNFSINFKNGFTMAR